MKGKLIIIEGTDCSGKATQTEKLVEKLKEEGYNVNRFSFPNYDSPTGKIIGGPLLGKDYICNGWFPETSPKVDPLVASAYYAADRRYNIGKINETLASGGIAIVDRYVESNMAHRGGKIEDKDERLKMYQKLDELEFGIMELPRPDAVIFLYMPFEYACILKKSRAEKPDENEANEEHLRRAEKAYLELTDLYNFTKIDCVKNSAIRSINEISEDVYKEAKKIIEEK